MFHPIWILWVYLTGIPITWAAFAEHAGKKVTVWLEDATTIAERVYQERLAAHKRRWTALNPTEYVKFNPMAASPFIAWLVVQGFLTGALWPLLLPVGLFFKRGLNVGERMRKLRSQLAEANEEIDRIRQKEGWA